LVHKAANTEQLKSEICQIGSFSYMYFTFIDTFSNGLIGLRKSALFIQDSTSMEMTFKCFGKNSASKLDQFDAIVESLHVRN